MNEIQVAVRGLAKSFGACKALAHVSFETSGSWSCLGILGRNGAGKTTLLKALAGLITFDAGAIDISVQGSNRAIFGPDLAVFIPEQPRLLPSFTGHRYLRFFEALNACLGVPTDAELRAALADTLDMKAQLPKRVRDMSKGTKRKLELMAAASTNVPFIIADELPEGLDIPTMRELESLIKSLGSQNKRFIISSHNLSFLSDACDLLAVIDQGACVDFIRMDGSPDLKERILSAFRGVPVDAAS